MRKSLMLSTTIMLIILFLTLSATTYAWYQAQGGTINVSGSSTASVTTTGPDNPYLIISGNTHTTNPSNDSPTVANFGSLTITDNNYGTYKSANFDSSATERQLQLATLTVNGSSISWNDISGTSTTPTPITFYIRNTSPSFDLAAEIDITATINGNTVHLLDTDACDYRVLLYISNSTYNNGTASSDTAVYSPYYNSGLRSKGFIGSTTTISTQIFNIINTGVYYKCELYVWIDAYDSNGVLRNSNYSVSQLNAFSNLQVTFGSVTIVTD